MNKSKILLALSAIALSHMTQAGTMGSVSTWKRVATLSAGPVWARAGETQTFYLVPEIEKTYVVNKSSQILTSGELFLGGQKLLSGDWYGQLGLAVGLSGNAKINGIIWDDADPQFDNYSYSYKIFHTRVAAKGKVLKDCGGWVTPWVSASLGAAFNRAYGFKNTPLIFEALPNSNFGDKTKTAFTYTVGAGLQKNIFNNWQVGAGYEFADWGQSELARASGQSLNSGLKLDHLYTNGVLFNISYVG